MTIEQAAVAYVRARAERDAAIKARNDALAKAWHCDNLQEQRRKWGDVEDRMPFECGRSDCPVCGAARDAHRDMMLSAARMGGAWRRLKRMCAAVDKPGAGQ